MSLSRLTVLFAALLVGAASAQAQSVEPIRVIEDSLEVPEGMTVAQALAAVEDIASIFEEYEPVVPWIPGVKLDLSKQVVSAQSPTLMEIPVDGAVFGRDIVERAQVLATTTALVCDAGEGVRIELNFQGSSRNIERRIDRIEISACPRISEDGTVYIDAKGLMFEGAMPRDPNLNSFNENVGANALQSAFLKQVPAVFTAVEQHWADMPIAG